MADAFAYTARSKPAFRRDLILWATCGVVAFAFERKAPEATPPREGPWASISESWGYRETAGGERERAPCRLSGRRGVS